MRKVKKISLLVLMFSLAVLAACDKKCTPSSDWSFDDSKHWHECSDCEEIHNVNVHKLTWSVKTAATCEVGLVEKGVCGCGYTTTRLGPKLEHKSEDLLGSDPTCKEPGLTDGKKCSVCDKILIEQKEIPMLEHTHGEPVIENEVKSTCENEGHYDLVVYCSICNEEISREKVMLDLILHTEVVLPGKDPTCNEHGLTEGKKCSVCDEILVEQKEIAMLEHIHSEAEIENVVKSTCKDAGYYDWVVYCSICNEEISREKVKLELLPHTEIILPGKEATCNEHGLTEGKKCSVCDEILVEQKETPMLEHTPSFAVTENMVNSTCEEAGHFDLVTYCSICNEEIRRITMSLGVSPHREVILPGKEATCNEHGLTEGKKCSVCDEILVEQKEIAMLEHIHSEPVIENEVKATCKDAGHYDWVVYCSICNEEISREKVILEILPHTEVVLPGKAPTCNEHGLTEGKQCSVCDEILIEQKEIPMLEHTSSFAVTENMVNSTCKEAGHYDLVTYCSICNEEIRRITMSLGVSPHREVILPGKEATCEELGLTEGKKCSLCDEILAQQEEILALGHDITHSYYEESNGVMMLVEICSRCDISITEVDITKPIKVSNYKDLVTILNAGYETLLTSSVDLPTAIVISKDVKLTIADGVEITLKNDTVGDGAFRVINDATLTISGEGTINGVGNNAYNMAIWANGGHVIINGGTFTNVGAVGEDPEYINLLFVSGGGSIIINGGTFIAETPQWTLNIIDDDTLGKITVYGGNFMGYDPANSKTEPEGANNNFVATGYISILDSNGYYNVMKQTSIVEALEIGGAKVSNQYTTEKYILVGTVKNVYNTQYGNMYITDSEGNEICIYGLYSADGKTRYDAMGYKPITGDIVIVSGVLGKYEKTIQMKDAWLLSCTAHTHDFTEATCKEPKTCSICKVAEGETLPHIDSEKDHVCDICEAKVGVHKDETDDLLCDYCGEEISDETPIVETLAEFTFGANGKPEHVDGSDYGTSKSFTAGEYNLELNGMSKVFGTAYDAKGNSCIKLGAGSAIGSFKFTVPENVTEVVIYVAKYKSNATKITVNGASYNITTASDAGLYTAITIDTSINKTITLSTVSSTYRCMINTIVFNGYAE